MQPDNTVCRYGCLFDGDKLYGDCRMPEDRKDCAMNNYDGKHLAYEYEWLHIPTGKRGNNKLRVHSRQEFLEAISKWNTTNPKQEWVYTEKL